jgi:hypothetical protein
MTKCVGYAALLLTALAAGVSVTEAQTAVGFAVTPDGQAMSPFRASTVIESRITTGRPYSAEATTEFTQMLGDGNKIARKTTVRIFRDSDGRTRREELAADGTARSISIYDPVAHATYVLDPATRTARKSAVRVVYPATRAGVIEQKMKVDEKASTEIAVAGSAGTRVMLVAPADLPPHAVTEESRKRVTEVTVRGGAAIKRPEDVTEESLGQKLVEGVMADGKRVTTVLPAGTVGNQQPIRIVSEQWFSPDLEILVTTRHADPRSGDTSYTLTNIVRAEPQAGLFDVPADYSVVGSGYMRYPDQR